MGKTRWFWTSEIYQRRYTNWILSGTYSNNRHLREQSESDDRYARHSCATATKSFSTATNTLTILLKNKNKCSRVLRRLAWSRREFRSLSETARNKLLEILPTTVTYLISYVRNPVPLWKKKRTSTKSS